MTSLRSLSRASLLASLPLILSACFSGPRKADLGAIYNDAAQGIGAERTPVVVLPGILGSKLEDPASGRLVWGAFIRGAVDADYPEGARIVALPMEEGVSLSQLNDNVRATGVLDSLEVDLALIARLRVGAYVDILRTLAAGKYRDRDLARGAGIEYNNVHTTCFQFPYDWRHGCSDQAILLHERIKAASKAAVEARGLPAGSTVKLDVLAHSMGGLVLRYYLRYGPTPLPEDGSLPPLTWEGAKLIRRAVFIGTPNGGSTDSMTSLTQGLAPGVFAPNYRSPILGTMPSIYQLIPRTRHGRFVDAETREPIDLFDVATWQHYGWGLADPGEMKVLRWLLPDAETDEDRKRIALDHLAKCLARAEQFHRAIDVPATPPPGLEMDLFAGDAIPTPNIVGVTKKGKLKVLEKAPGDNTVTRASALMDERVGSEWRPRLDSPVEWDRIQFLAEDHLGLTKSTEFSDNLLFLLLESPLRDTVEAEAL